MKPKDQLLHGRDSKGKYLTLTPTYAETVNICPEISEYHYKCLLSSCGHRTSSLRTWRTCVVQTTPITSSRRSPCKLQDLNMSETFPRSLPHPVFKISFLSPGDCTTTAWSGFSFYTSGGGCFALISTRYSSRINFDVDCPMEFYKFPFDKQVPKVLRWPEWQGVIHKLRNRG